MAPRRGAVRYLAGPYHTKVPLTINAVLATDWSKCALSVLIGDNLGTTQNFNDRTCQILEVKVV